MKYYSAIKNGAFTFTFRNLILSMLFILIFYIYFCNYEYPFSFKFRSWLYVERNTIDNYTLTFNIH